MTTTLSLAVLSLPHLRSLFFNCCFTSKPQFIAASPTGLGPAFRALVLCQNVHVGPIQAELGNLSTLRVLDLYGSQLTVTAAIPANFPSFTQLQMLKLSYNLLADLVPHFSTSSASASWTLDLSYKVLHGDMPSSIGQCRFLLNIDFSKTATLFGRASSR